MSDEINVQAKNKKTKLVIAISAVAIAVLTIVAIVLVSANSATAKKVKEQLSLGEKYLSELNYEQAIVAYELAIEIDPKCEEAYLALAEIYIENGELDKAAEILDKADEQFMSKAIWEKQQEVEEATEKQSMVTATPMPSAKPTETVTVTSTPTPVPTVTPTETPTTVPLSTPSTIPTPTEALTLTATPRPTNTPTPVPTSTPAAVAELKRVELKMESDCFTYGISNKNYVCTGFSEKGFDEFKKYDANYLLVITLPSISDTGDKVVGFHSKSKEGYDLKDMLIEGGARIEIVCPKEYVVYYGVYDNVPDITFIDKLEGVKLNEGLEVIGNNAFYSCKGITSLVIPESVRKFGSRAFAGCNNLVIDEIELGGKNVEWAAFEGVTVKRLKVSDKVEACDTGGGFGSLEGMQVEELVLAETLEEISDYLFRECEWLVEIAIPESVERIGDYAFDSCINLERVIIPDNVKEIGRYAFNKCMNLDITTSVGSATDTYAKENNILVKYQ